MQICAFFVFYFVLIFDEGLSCGDLSGTWMNEMGPTMFLQHVMNTNILTGHYYTRIDKEIGADSKMTNISGVVQPVTSAGSLLAFNVLWNNGASQEVWVGECRVCNNKDTLYTTWLMRTYEPAKKRWFSTTINYNTFVRINGGTEIRAKDDPKCKNSNPGIMGKWTSKTGDSFDITCTTKINAVKGTHLSMDADTKSPLIGQFAGNSSYTALGFVSSRRKTIRGWAGYKYGSRANKGSIDAAWLEHEFTHNCNNPRENVRFGIDIYTKAR